MEYQEKNEEIEEKKEVVINRPGPYDNVKISVKVLDCVIVGGIAAALALIAISII
ncbi:MAG TPA: hypothetical protein IAC62_11850 [Candidatus Pelethocola excrementipullorum]|nr:hypothetical protein [Candidatus Pelethocola excrementipullorum]